MMVLHCFSNVTWLVTLHGYYMLMIATAFIFNIFERGLICNVFSLYLSIVQRKFNIRKFPGITINVLLRIT